ncbi:hypothetical protein RSAG8_10715, partial [Rhizoctonia solani AG-8 WAC10335]
MYSINDAREHFESIAEDFAKPDWETSPSSITHKLRNLVEKHKNNTPPRFIKPVERAIVDSQLVERAMADVQKFEIRIHHRCRVKKPDAPIHPDPFWCYNGYDDALESLVANMSDGCSKDVLGYREKYPDMLWVYGLHFDLRLTLDLWRTHSQLIKDAPAIEASLARSGAFAAEMEALREEFPTFF